MSAAWLNALRTLAIALAVVPPAACARDLPPDHARSGSVRSADGVPIVYEVRGRSTPTLVFVHGSSCDRSYWREQLDPFSRDYRVVALDLAGHGASGADRSEWSIANFANDVAAVVQAIGAGDVIVIGHSLGGPVALEAGLLLPDSVVGVIGVDAFFDVLAEPAMMEIDRRLREDFAGTMEAFVRDAMFLPTSPPELVDSIAQAMASAPPEIAVPVNDASTAWTLTRQADAVAALAAPIGLIMAAGSPPGITRFTRARGTAPFVGVDVVPDAGHFLMLEAPDVFNARLRSMLGRLRAVQG